LNGAIDVANGIGKVIDNQSAGSFHGHEIVNILGSDLIHGDFSPIRRPCLEETKDGIDSIGVFGVIKLDVLCLLFSLPVSFETGDEGSTVDFSVIRGSGSGAVLDTTGFVKYE